MGGTYWYYYKVDEDEECHNPSQPSTTFCPLLPGQRLNVLDVPRETHGRSSSDPSAFTRDPKDRFLKPVPPAPLNPVPSPRPGAAGFESGAMPLPSPWVPRSATYPPTDTFLSPNVVRHARSASASPYMPSTPIFADFKVLKEKLSSKRSASRIRSSSKPKELEISSPVLISSTVEGLNRVPLSVYQPTPASSPRDTSATTTPKSRPLPFIRKEFSPLGSHPVDPENDSIFNFSQSSVDREQVTKRRRSYVPSKVITSEFELGQGRIRANSSDTRRTQHYCFSNDPWLSSPQVQQEFEFEEQDRLVMDDTPSAPVLSRPASIYELPAEDYRPCSSHGGDRSSSLRQAPLDKELPALPRYLTPAPLFACNGLAASNVFSEEPREEPEEKILNLETDFVNQFQRTPRSHFSTWSNDSVAYSSPTSDDDAILSPTFSSLTSDCSEADLMQHPSVRYSYIQQTDDTKRHSTIPESRDELEEEHARTAYLSSTPPQLDNVRISTFGSDLFNLDIQHADSAPRRQAACFGLGFHYSLPDDETTSKTTLTDKSLRSEPSVHRESSISQRNTLMADFAFLGDAVI